MTAAYSDAQFRALFEPRGVVVAGASTHPGKFGFVSLHNILASGYEGKVFATNRDGSEVLGVQCATSIDDLPEGEIDLVFVCTPASTNIELLRQCAAKGITAAFLTSAGYGEAGEEGIKAQAELVAVAQDLGILMAGPNGQGVVSTPAQLCAQIVAPYPPAGGIGVALMPLFLIRQELAAGELVTVGPSMVNENGYVLVQPARGPRDAPAERFRSWLLETIRQERDAQPA